MKLRFLLLLFVVGCQNSPESPELKFHKINNSLEDTVSVISTTPGSEGIQIPNDVPIDTAIEIEFSGPVDWGSVSSSTVRVEDEHGEPIPGEISLSDDDRKISFQPMRFGEESLLNSSSEYTVRTQFLKNDTNGLSIGFYSFQFRTQDTLAESSGDFYITDVRPDTSIKVLMPNSKIQVEFSQEIMPPQDPGSAPHCSNSEWLDAFQILAVDFIDDDGYTSLTPVPGEVCLYQDENGNDTILEFEPTTEDGYWPGGYIDIVVRPSEQLRSIHGEPLDDSISRRRWIPFNILF